MRIFKITLQQIIDFCHLFNFLKQQHDSLTCQNDKLMQINQKQNERISKLTEMLLTEYEKNSAISKELLKTHLHLAILGKEVKKSKQIQLSHLPTINERF